MPRLDGTGPAGGGPMTGGGRGRCGASRPAARTVGSNQGYYPTTTRYNAVGSSRFPFFRWFRSRSSGVIGGRGRGGGGRGRGRGR